MNSDLIFEFELFDSLPEMYFLLNTKGEIIQMNTPAKDILQLYSKNLPVNFLDLVELCDRKETADKFIKSNSDKKSSSIQTKLFHNKKYTDVNLTFSLLSSLKDKENRSFILVSARDISTEIRKEEELTRFFNIVENNINPIQVTDLNGKMVYVNPAMVRVSGYSKEELIGKNPRIFGSGKYSKKFWDMMWQTISSGKAWFGEVEDKRKNGEPFYTQLLISPIVDETGKISGYFGVHRDMSEKKTLEQQLIRTQKMESIGTLAAGIAHEVGNPLASISALVQVTLRNTKDEFIIEKLGLVKNQITRISKIIRDLVDFSRPSNFELQTTDINKCLQEAVEITKVGTKAKDIAFNVVLSHDVPSLPLVADQIEQVFVNILINAVDAINEHTTNDKEKQIDIQSAIVDEEVIVTFSDNGPGIKKEHLNKIFEPFFTTKEKGKGTGLGLWVSYGIIKSFQGKLEVNSEPGEGTTFTIQIPTEQ